ncbi:MAG: hypothetical protein AAGA77_19410 [Bacteroidota bacterium]
MSNLFDFFKNLFGRDDSGSSRIPFLHETIDVNSFSINEIEKWKALGTENKFANLVNAAYRNYYISGKTKTNLSEVTLLVSSHTNGWYLHCNMLVFKDVDYKYLAYSLSMKLKNEGYVIQLAEMKSTTKSEGIENITHYYLKPSLKFQILKEEGKVNQLYGNISMEYKTLNGVPISFKFLAKAYSDSNYKPPMDQTELQHILFQD